MLGFASSKHFSQYFLLLPNRIPSGILSHFNQRSHRSLLFFWVSRKMHEVLGQIVTCCVRRTDQHLGTKPSSPTQNPLSSRVASWPAFHPQGPQAGSWAWPTSRLRSSRWMRSSKARLCAVPRHSNFSGFVPSAWSLLSPCPAAESVLTLQSPFTAALGIQPCDPHVAPCQNTARAAL